MYRLESSKLSTRRIDPWHYQPEFTKKIEKIYDVTGGKELINLIDSNRDVAGGATPLGAEYLLNGRVRFYRTSEIDGMHIDSENAVFISDEDDEKLKRSRLNAGDVLLTITGAKFGKSGVVEECHLPGNISQHSVRFTPNKNVLDPYFLVAYLDSRIGQIAIWREAYGATRPAIDFPSVRSLLIPSLSMQIQQYIGDKVRQAERLRSWARATENAVTNFHNAFIPSQDYLDFTKSVRIVSPERMGDRLDAHYYPGVVDEYLRNNAGNFESLANLCSTIYNGQTQPEITIGNSCQQVTVANLSSSFLCGTPRSVEVPGKKDKFLKTYDILICNAAHNKSYIGKDLTFVHSGDLLLPSTEVMVVRVNTSLLPASYVRSYLQTKIGYVQIQSTIRGITAHSYPDDMAQLEIFIPKIGKEIRGDWFSCDEKLAKAGNACYYATILTTAAKLLVEALIEGHLDEPTIIAAQEQLQSGTTTLDRVILSRLKTDGIDGKGQPLFSDLDELYRLLALAKEE